MPISYRQSSVVIGVSLLLLFLSMAPVEAEQIALKLVDGRPCAMATIQCGDELVKANVVFDLGQKAPIVLHTKTCSVLGVQSGGSVTLLIEGVSESTFADMPVLASENKMLETLTREHAPELDEIPAVAIIGLSAFSELVPQLDLSQGRLVLLSSEEASELAKFATFVVPLETIRGRFFFGALGPNQTKMRLQLKTLQYDTLIDKTVAAKGGAENGAILSLYPTTQDPEGDEEGEEASEKSEAKNQRLNLAQFVAFRPVKLSVGPKPRPDMILGTNLLQYFRVTIDTKQKRLLWEQVGEPRYPTEERDFFTALVQEDADGIEKFLTKHPRSRLAQEAGVKHLDLRLAEKPADSKALVRAINLRTSSTQKNRRATMLLELADVWLTGTREDRFTLATLALELALKYARNDLDATASHRIQARLGRIAFVKKDFRTARRRLLAAAFGLPRDPQVNLWLGELYEVMKKPARAWSRYLQATLADLPPLEAYVGLGRLNRDPAFREHFSMRDAAELLEGRIETFHPKRHYIQEQEKFPQHVKIIELFTNIYDVKKTQAAEAAIDAIGEYFDIETAEEPVAVLAYHLMSRRPDPLAVSFSQARAKFYKVAYPPTAIFDGTGHAFYYGTSKEVVPVYEAYLDRARSAKKVVADEKETPAVEITLSGKVQRDKRRLTGQVVVDSQKGELEKAALHVVVCESVVMVPAKNGRVLHRYVVRGSLTPDEGMPLESKIEPGKGPFVFEINLDTKTLAKDLATHMDALEKQHRASFVMKPDYVDAREVILVAFVQDMTTQKILGTTTIRPSKDQEVSP